MRLLVFILLPYLISAVAFGQEGSIIQKADKYGIFDKNHGVILTPECDTIISKPHTWNDRFFILKKGSKYAYAYFRNLDSLGNFGYLEPHWEISRFDFDDLVVIASKKTLQFITHLVLRYKKKGKYGLIYIRTHLFWLEGPFEISRIDGLGELNKTEAIYDNPFSYIDDKLLHVKSKGKYSLLEFVDKDKNWINYTYHGIFDSIVVFNQDLAFYRSVRKNGKWGILKIDVEKKEMNYVVPCDCDTVWDCRFRTPDAEITSNIVFLCEKRADQKAVIYDGRDTLSVIFINKPPIYHFGGGVLMDTIPNENAETHKNYALISLGSYDKQSMILSNRGQCLVDMQSSKTTFYIDNDSTMYEIFFGYHGIIIEKQIKTENSVIFEYIDFVTGEQKMVLESKKDISYITGKPIYHDSKNDYLLIMMVKEKKGEKKFTYKYYYDFRKKKFFKGKCKGCQ